MADWHRQTWRAWHSTKLYSIDEVAGVFGAAGFEVAGARLKIGFVPVSGRQPDSIASAPELLRSGSSTATTRSFLRCKRPSSNEEEPRDERQGLSCPIAPGERDAGFEEELQRLGDELGWNCRGVEELLVQHAEVDAPRR